MLSNLVIDCCCTNVSVRCPKGSEMESKIKEQIHKFCTDALPLEDQKHPISPFYVYNRFLWSKYSKDLFYIRLLLLQVVTLIAIVMQL